MLLFKAGTGQHGVYHDSCNGKFLLAQILPQEFSEKPILKKNNQTCQGLLPRRNDEALPEVLAETAPERVARTGRTTWIETTLP